ncbi:FMN reductase [Couchioplanes caeruleus]|uniref:FMN reductase n=1 Tax=Couchioplanes caeruleus TaxID=56438 RepID=UPI0020BF6155|nr:FMN reductase [Couchioplanes caeruleus]UQU61313.1 FMN reductase [Couchioplanes caeruleus]
MTQRTLVVVTAGLSQPSSTRLLADQLSAAAVERAAALGAGLTVRVVELRDVAHDLMDHLLTGFPPAALREALDAVAAADGLIAVTPIFNASYSGLFKSFFDVVGKDALQDKPVLLAATGGTARHSLALEHALRPMFAYLRAATVATSVFAASEDWGGEDELRTRIDRAAAELAREIERREPAQVTDPFALTTSFEELLAGN